jgi:hypothetical protein
VFSPSGSRKNWCCVFSGNRTILSSIDGQYRGPIASICPVYIGDRCTFSRISRSVSGVVVRDVATHLPHLPQRNLKGASES